MRRGFTLIELLVVILILSILMALVVPVVVHVIGVAKHAAAEAFASQLVTCLKSYELQHATYPPGDGHGSRGLVEALSSPGAKKLPLLEVTPDMLTPTGDLVNPAQHDADAPLNAYHYRNNRGRKPGPDGDGRPGVSARRDYDLWCAGNDYSPLRPDSAWSIHRP